MEFVRRILKRGIYAYDRNSLHPFERALFLAVQRIRAHNILFMSLQAQLKSFLTLQTNRMSGIPDWLSRGISDGCIFVKQQRFVGGSCGPPPIHPNPSFSFEITKFKKTSDRYE